MTEEPTAVLRDLSRRLGCAINDCSVVHGGTQNRLFRIDLGAASPLLLKVYHRDRWNRLSREFAVLSALGSAGVQRVPRAIMKNDELDYGVFSFEAGSVRTATQLKRSELLEVASFLADLRQVTPDSIRSDLAPAVDSGLSVNGQLQVIDSRLRAYEEFAASGQAYAEVRKFNAEVDLRAHITAAVVRVTAELSEAARATTLPRCFWHVSSGDFGPQNFLFTDDRRLTVVDFESGGWDDPARLVMGFLAHATTEDLPAEAANAFLAAYAAVSDLSPAEISRFERTGRLLDVEWVAVYASALVPEVIVAKQFANPAFDLHAYLEGAIARLRRRLQRVDACAVYRFPD